MGAILIPFEEQSSEDLRFMDMAVALVRSPVACCYFAEIRTGGGGARKDRDPRWLRIGARRRGHLSGSKSHQRDSQRALPSLFKSSKLKRERTGHLSCRVRGAWSPSSSSCSRSVRSLSASASPSEPTRLHALRHRRALSDVRSGVEAVRRGKGGLWLLE